MAYLEKSYREEFEKDLGGRYTLDDLILFPNQCIFTAIDNNTKEPVIIKKVIDIYKRYESPLYNLHQIKVIPRLNHSCLTNLIALIAPSHYKAFHSFYIITESKTACLSRVIFGDFDLTEDHHRYIMYQILIALKYLHSANILHRNLSPYSIFIDNACDIKVSTLGIEEFHEFDNHFRQLNFKPPEMAIRYENHHINNDMWSVGLIFASLIERKQLYHTDELNEISKLIGSPTKDDLHYLNPELASLVVEQFSGHEPQEWRQILPHATENEIDLISKMLLWNPSKRISIEEALKHNYFEQLHDPDDEPTTTPINVTIDTDIERTTLKNEFWNAIQEFNANKASH